MLYQNNEHWHGADSADSAAAVALVVVALAVAAGAAAVALAVVASAGVTVEEDSLMAVVSAVEEDSSSINISYRQSTKPMIVPAMVTITKYMVMTETRTKKTIR